MIAQRCTFTFEIRHTVDHDPDELLRPFWQPSTSERAAAGNDVGGSVDVTEITRYPALRTADRRSLAARRRADRRRGPGTSIGFGTEGGLFAEALDASVVICGPGDIAVAHRPDEYVSVDQLLRCERFLCGLVRQLCVEPCRQRARPTNMEKLSMDAGTCHR